MPHLSVLKHEHFANHLASGMTQERAYKACGLKSKNPAQAASALFKKAEIKARVRELVDMIGDRVKERAVAHSAMDKEWVMSWLRVQVVEGGTSAVRNRALELIGKEIGMFADRDSKEPVRLEDLSTADLKRLLGEPEVAASEASNVPAVEPEIAVPEGSEAIQ